MSAERTREVMSRYWDSDHHDLSMMADDVVFEHMATGDVHRGPDEVRKVLDYMYRQAFDATAEIRSRICSESQAVLEAEFVGKHIGEFAKIPATGRSVRVPSAWCTISRRTKSSAPGSTSSCRCSCASSAAPAPRFSSSPGRRLRRGYRSRDRLPHA